MRGGDCRAACAQRNAGLAVLAGDSDVVAFFDDDFVPSRFAVETLSSLFAQHPDIAGATGHVLADGIKTPGIPAARAERLVEEHDCHGPPSMTYLRDVHGLYGCNMAYRTALLGGLRFDERLKLYGWQEDVDFARKSAVAGARSRPTPLPGSIWGQSRAVPPAFGSAIRRSRTRFIFCARAPCVRARRGS
jgi:hypothetical protein